jgi:hypothetical protein
VVERKELKPERVGLDALAVLAAAELGVEPIGLGELPSGQLPELVEEGDVVLVVGLDAGEGQVVPAVVPAAVTEDRGVGRAVGGGAASRRRAASPGRRTVEARRRSRCR